MPRRVSMPAADELFRNTARSPEQDRGASRDQAPIDPPASAAAEGLDNAKGSGRVKHAEKMTIYLTAQELMAVEKARLELHGELGRKVDRGRMVRAALALALEGLEADGIDSDIAQRLSEP